MFELEVDFFFHDKPAITVPLALDGPRTQRASMPGQLAAWLYHAPWLPPRRMWPLAQS